MILDGLMFVFGGNTHNDTAISHGARCFSSKFLVYDIGPSFFALNFVLLLFIMEFIILPIKILWQVELCFGSDEPINALK